MRFTKKKAWLVGAAAVAVIASACGSSGGGSTSSNNGGGGSGSGAAKLAANLNTYNASPAGDKSPGGTVYWAQATSGSANYIFPMENAQVFGTTNAQFLSYMLYRPLYWFGNNNKPTVDYDYSLATAPVFTNNDQTVTIHLKPWKWSNGETVTSRDLEFWMNLYKANPAENYGGYVPPASSGEKFFPDNVTSMSTPDPSTFVMNLSQSYNPTWFLYNELAQVFPMPLAWDRTSLSQPAPTSDTGSLPDASPSTAEAVYKFLDTQSKATTTWTTSPLWTTVDGPFKLSNFAADGELDFVPNADYSGSPKPSISKFVELPYTDDNAEVTALKTSGTAGLTIGYIPPEDATQQQTLTAQGYGTQSSFDYSFNYFPLNLNNPTLGSTFRQLYFRQAFQHLVNQPGWLAAFLNGWGTGTYGPVPTQPPNSFSSKEENTNPYPFSVSAAKQLLTSHGWTVVPGGVTTCAKPGSAADECGDGVPAGTKLEFNLDYKSGTQSLTQEMNNLQSQAAAVGIKLDLTTHDFGTVISTAVNCKSTDPTCKWTAENWGAGWVYSPDYYASGESLFLTGAATNFSNYSDSRADQLIGATTTGPDTQSQSTLNTYQNYLVQQLPVVYGPTSFGNPIPGGPALIDNKLGGVVPNAFSFITPETYYFTK